MTAAQEPTATLVPSPDKPGDDPTPAYLRVLTLLDQCRTEELQTLKLLDIPAVQRKLWGRAREAAARHPAGRGTR